MYFFEKREEYRNRIFCIEETGASYTYSQVWEIGDTLTAAIPSRSLILLLVGNDVRSVSCYLALLRRRCPVILMGRRSDPEMVSRMKETYRPDYVIDEKAVQACGGAESPSADRKNADDQAAVSGAREHAPIHPQLGLLLSTSGSTGAQKLVRLSYDNLQANCDSIVEYLQLTAEERPVTTLPMEYTYGLSVIHSHAAAGASIILTDRTLFEPGFWDLVEKQGATSMAGVPYTYEMLERLRFRRMELPSLKTMTQAGGHLKTELQESFGKWAQETGRRLFVMYGQTEATARMSYIPWDKCLEKIGSIGVPVPGGEIELLDENGEVIEETGVSGELIYYGENVSMGYAVCREDLAKEDENRGRLETGDMAYRDEDGYFFITGRKKRFVKLYGKRMSLDQIQDDLQEIFDTPNIVCTGDDACGVQIWMTAQALQAAGSADKTDPEEVFNMAEDQLFQLFMDRWGIRDRMVHIHQIKEIPRNASGKTIYADLNTDKTDESRDK